MVAVAPGASLEVLDWGGSGRPLVLLAGLHNTAHVFDDFAPSFTDSFHVYAITRRGFGRSSQPPDSDAAMLVSDLRIVLDSLRLSRVILVGHSIAGEELTGFAVSYLNRCEALIYLDAAYDRSGSSALKALAKMPWPTRPPMTSADSASVAAVKAYYERTDGVRMLDGDARAVFRFDSAGRFVFEDSLAKRMIGRLVGHLAPPAYQRLTCPSLAIYAVPDSPRAAVPWYTLLDSAGRAQAERLLPRLQAWSRASRTQYRQNAPLAHIVEIHNAHHYVFESNRAETLHAIRAFVATLTTPRRERSSGVH
jgi:pimeloyl-ACP methyl ester carboxylesterase